MNKITIFSFTFLGMLVLISCSNDADIVKRQISPSLISLEDSVEYFSNYSDSIGRTIKFAPAYKNAKELKKSAVTRGSTLDTYIDDEIDIEPVLWFFRVSLEFGRKSRNCRGFGICHFSIKLKDYITNSDDASYDNCSGIIEKDSSGREFVDFLLAEPLSPDVDESALLLPIEEDIHEEVLGYPDELSTDTNLPRSYKLKKGVLHFNPNLGIYGGYRIYIDPIY